MPTSMKPLLALVLTLILPLRAFASVGHCEVRGPVHGLHACAHGAALSHADGAALSHADGAAVVEPDAGRHSPDTLAQHGCGDCCGAAAVTMTPIRFDVSSPPAAEVAERLARLQPTLTIDRLDRPPRLPA
jgi:hypothetical protein